jgi:TonB family protein
MASTLSNKKAVLASLLLLIASSRPLLAGEDPGAQQLLLAAQRQANLFSPDASPWQLEIDFVAQVRMPAQGHVTYRWEAADRWWRKVSIGDFQEIEVKNGERLYTLRNAAFTPLRITELNRLVSVARNTNHLQVKKQKQRVEGGLAISCLEVRKEDEKGEGYEVCVNPPSREIFSYEWKTHPDGNGRQEYSDFVEFHGHRYPRKMELFENGIKVISAQVVSLSTVPFDQALLVPPQGAIERRLCANMKPPVPVKQPDPLYPKSAIQNRVMGDTTVSMTVFVDGSVGEIQLLGSSTHSLDDATLQTLKGWKFKPAMCGAEPVVSDIQVVVNFRLR